MIPSLDFAGNGRAEGVIAPAWSSLLTFGIFSVNGTPSSGRSLYDDLFFLVVNGKKVKNG